MQPATNNGNLRTNCPHDDETGNLLLWHDAATWTSGQIPQSGEDVTLPANSKVVITQSIADTLGIITVPESSELIFAEETNNDKMITLDVAGMDIQGALRAGSETCRYETNLVLTLHGSRPNDVTVFGTSPTATTTYKGVSVTGTISLHGKRFYPTWSRLAEAAAAGQTYILLQESVNWEPGQEIVLTTTAIHDSRNWHENEVLTISYVVNNPVPNVGAAIHLSAPLVHDHIANGGYQAEVGLLTRNIKVQGSENDSEPTDPDPGTCTGSHWHFGTRMEPCPGMESTGFGGHIIVHSGGKGYLEGVELYRKYFFLNLAQISCSHSSN